MDLTRWDRAKEIIGNTFELSALLQKRCRELVKEGKRKLVDIDSRNPIQIALEEVLQGKIKLTEAPKQPPPPEATAGEPPPAAAAPAPSTAPPVESVGASS